MTCEINKSDKFDPNNTHKKMEQSLKVESNYAHQDSNLEREQIETRQRVFNQSPEYKKREIVFGQIQRINSRLSDLEEKVNEILAILKADR